MTEHVVLVDENDRELGTMDKMEAHREAKLHRAFSVFITNSQGQLMLQQRALSKYHSSGLWSNTCCSHPRKGEDVLEAAHRRLREEMGFDTELKEAFTFIYKIQFDNNLWEHEMDHVILGRFDGEPKLNREEVENWKWIEIEDLEKDIKENPDRYTYWFRVSFDKVKNNLE